MYTLNTKCNPVFTWQLEEEELEEFEMLEEAAANSSMSSNCSVVVRMLAKAKGIRQDVRPGTMLTRDQDKPLNGAFTLCSWTWLFKS